MALINETKREINAKVVYFGPGLAGKSSNLRHIYGKLKPEFRGTLKGMQVKEARMLFFDFTPPGDSSVQGFKVRFHVYTVSGEVTDPAVWKTVLKGADGVVFVADSAIDRVSANRASLEGLTDYLTGYGMSLSTLPVVFQYNKKDLPDALPAADLNRMLNAAGRPHFEASSQEGEGVIQTLLALVKSVLVEMRKKGVEGIAPPESVRGVVEIPPAEDLEEGAAGLAPEEPQPVEEGAEMAAAPYEPPPSPPAAPVAPAVEEGELSLEFAGAVELHAGRLTLPLLIRAGERSRTVTLQLSLSEE